MKGVSALLESDDLEAVRARGLARDSEKVVEESCTAGIFATKAAILMRLIHSFPVEVAMRS